MQPTCGRIVHYRLTAADCKRIDDRRNRHAVEIPWRNEHGEGIAVQRAFDGNTPRPGDIVPLLVVRVWDNEYTADDGKVGHDNGHGETVWTDIKSHVGINGQAFLDGNDSLWVTSAPHGDGDGCWDWPPRT